MRRCDAMGVIIKVSMSADMQWVGECVMQGV